MLSILPNSVFQTQSETSLKLFSDAWGAFIASYSDEIRIRNREAALYLVELTVTYFAGVEPEKLKHPAMGEEFVDIITHRILKNPVSA